jgi:hypothetical protein
MPEMAEIRLYAFFMPANPLPGKVFMTARVGTMVATPYVTARLRKRSFP